MNRKRLLRAWWLWAAVGVFAFLVLPGLLAGGSDYQGVSTTDALTQISKGNVVSAIVSDKEQTLELVLKQPFHGASKISTEYPAYAAQTITDLLTTTARRLRAG